MFVLFHRTAGDQVPNDLLIMIGLGTFALGALLMWGADVNTPLSIIVFVMIGRFGQA